MANRIRRVDYFYTTVQDQPGEAYKLLSLLAELGVNLLAVTSIPVGPMHTQFAIFPEDSLKLVNEAKKAGLPLGGPNPALLVQGDDKMGVLADIHVKLYEAGVNVYSTTGVTSGKGSFGYIIYVRADAYDRAVEALNV